MKLLCTLMSCALIVLLANLVGAQTFTVTESSDFDDGSAPYSLREAIRLVNEAPVNNQKIINFAVLNDAVPSDYLIFVNDLPFIFNNNVTINGYNATTDSKIRLLGNKEISNSCISFGPANSGGISNNNNSIKNVIFDKFLLPLRFRGSNNFTVSECEFYCTSMFLNGSNTMIECRYSINGQIDNNLILPQYFGTKPDNITNTKGIAFYNDCSQIQIDNNQIHQCDQGIELFSASSIDITNNRTRFINGQISRYGNLFFCIVGNSINISFGGAGNQNLIYGLSDSQYYDVGISCDNESNILVYENSFDCLSVPIQNNDATMTIDYAYNNASGGSGVPGEVVYIYQSGTFNSDFINPRCNFCTNGYLFIGTAEVNDQGYWCLNFPTGFILNPNDYITGYSIVPPIGNNQGNTSDFVTGCHNADDQCPTLDISINNTLESCVQMCYDATVLQNGVPVNNLENISYQWFLPGSGEEYSPEVCVLNEGTLTLRVYYKCCSYQMDETVDFPNINLTVIPVNADCNNNFGSASVSVSSGQSPFVFSINTIPPQTSGSIFQNNYNFINIPAGDYIATVQDANNCSTQQNFTILGSSGLSLAVFKTDATCGQTNGTASAVLTGGAPPINYLWETGETTQSISDLAPGTYTVTVTDGAQCVAIDSVTINTSDGPQLTIFKTDATCGQNDGSATVEISGGVQPISVLWSNGMTTNMISGLSPGTYSVTVTDGNNCMVNSTVIVNSTNGPELTIFKTDASCGQNNGSATVEISGGVQPISVLWSNGMTTNMISGLSPGTYSVTVTDGNNCIVSSSVNINTSNGPELTINKIDATCGLNNGSASITINGGGPPYGIIWSNGATTSTINNLMGGLYSVTVNDAAGCQASESVMINSGSGPLVTINVVDANCGQNNGSAAAIVTSGLSPYNYLWSNGGTNSSITGLAAGQYKVTVTDTNNCQKVETATINSSGGPIVNITKTDADCGSASGTASTTASGGISPYNFVWSNSDTTQTIKGLLPGNYSVTVTDAQGCLTISTVVINSSGNILMSSANASGTKCGQNDGSVFLTISGGSSPFDFSIVGPVNIDLENEITASAVIDSLASGSYTYLITDANGCTSSGSFNISASQGVDFIITQQNFQCGQKSGTITITAIAGSASFNYMIANVGENNTGIFPNLSPGQYNIRMTDNNGCSKDSMLTTGAASGIQAVNDTIRFDFYSNPVVIDVVSNDNLNGENVFILNPVSQEIFNSAGLFIGTLLNNSSDQKAVEFYFHGNYDPITKKYTLNYPLELEKMYYTICLGSCPEACDTGTIVLINDYKCIENNGDFVNTFSPNGDGRNDVLVLPDFPQCKVAYSDFKVFSRWGEPVFSKENYGNNWDGKNDRGQDLPAGTYYYVMNFKSNDGKSFIIKNFIELIR